MPAQNLPGLVLDRAHPLSRGLVGWWPMNEGGGTRVNDVSGSGNHGAFGNITQGPTSGRTGGALGGAVRMDGSDDEITVPTSKSLAVLADITLCAWINITSFAGHGNIFGKGASYPNPYAFVYYSDKRLAFTRGNGVSQGYIESVSTIVGGRPEFVLATWSGGVNRIFIDGVFRDSNSGSNPTVTDNGLPLYIGRRSDGIIPFAGSMWGLRIYNRALDAREVAQLYADPLAGALAPVRTRRIYIAGGAPAPQAPTYFGSASNPADNGAANEPSTLAVTPPGSMVSGDLVVLIGTIQVVGTGNITVSATGGQTWSSVSESGANDAAWGVFWCEYNGTWSADPSLAFAAQGGTQATTAVMHVFRKGTGTSGSWAVDTAYAGASEASASPMVITGITPGANNNVVLAGWLITNASTWGTLSGAGWVAMATAQYRNTAGSDLSATFAHQLQLTAAATNNVSQVPSTATTGASFTMAWKLVAPGSAKFRRTRSEHGARMGSRQATR